MSRTYYIRNLVNSTHVLKDCAMEVDGDKIVSIRPVKTCGEEWHEYAVPGFIDIHTHGGAGFEFMDDSVDAMQTISRFYLKNGTTSFLVSTVTDSLEKTESVITTAEKFMKNNQVGSSYGNEATCLGVHLEGPWLSRNNAGAQNPEYCIPPDDRGLELIKRHLSSVKMVTFSYHTSQAGMLLSLLADNGIIPATGHDEAVDEQIAEGFRKGIKVVTHIYCATSGFRRTGSVKHLGTLEMALMTDGVSVEVIADGKHITKYIWDFILHNKKKDDILIISDSMRCAGMPEDPYRTYKLGRMDVTVHDGVAWLKDSDMFAGSVATMYSNFRRLVCEWGTDMSDAVAMTSRNQARLLGFSDRGILDAGAVADVVFLDQSMNIESVLKSGIMLKK